MRALLVASACGFALALPAGAGQGSTTEYAPGAYAFDGSAFYCNFAPPNASPVRVLHVVEFAGTINGAPVEHDYLALQFGLDARVSCRPTPTNALVAGEGLMQGVGVR